MQINFTMVSHRDFSQEFTKPTLKGKLKHTTSIKLKTSVPTVPKIEW